MKKKEWVFPQYRKYKGIDVWFKIVTDRNFIELKRLGERLIQHEVVAEQYPEMILIQDMLVCQEERWEVIEANDFELINSKQL